MPFCLTIIWLLGSVSLRPSRPDQFLRRYEISGPLYGLMREQSDQISLAAVDECVERVCPNNETVDTDQLIACAAKFNVRLSLRKMDPQDLGTIPTPSIIFLRNTEGGHADLALYLVKRVTSEGVLAYDFVSNKGWVFMPHDLVKSFAKEFTITLTKAPFNWSALNWPMLLLAVAIAIAIMVWVRSTRHSAVLSFLLVGIACTAGGCNTSGGSDVQIIQFQPKLIDLGVIDELPRKIEFESHVIFPTGAKITELTSSCGCLQLSEDIVGRWYAAGETIHVRGDLTTKGQVGERDRMIRVVTQNRQGEQQITHLILRYEVDAKPYSQPDNLVLRGFYGRPTAGTKFLAVCRRRTTDTPFEVDWSRTSSGPVSLAVATYETATYGEQGETKDDRFHFDAKSDVDAWSLDKHQMTIAFKGKSNVLTIPMSLDLKHPIEITSSRIFLGMTPENASISHRIRVVNRFDTDVDVRSIGSTEPSRCEIVRPVVAWVPGENVLEFKVRTGDERNRQELELKIMYQDERIPDQSIPISWINQLEQR